MLGNLLWIREGTSLHAGGSSQLSNLRDADVLFTTNSVPIMGSSSSSAQIAFDSFITRRRAFTSYPLCHLSENCKIHEWYKAFYLLISPRSTHIHASGEKLTPAFRARVNPSATVGLKLCDEGRTPARMQSWDVTCCQFSSSEGMAEK